jgi:hypothetical protein
VLALVLSVVIEHQETGAWVVLVDAHPRWAGTSVSTALERLAFYPAVARPVVVDEVQFGTLARRELVSPTARAFSLEEIDCVHSGLDHLVVFNGSVAIGHGSLP